jgi:hypothetical protein
MMYCLFLNFLKEVDPKIYTCICVRTGHEVLTIFILLSDGMAPLHAAAQMGCLSCIKWIVDDQGIDINLRDGDKATPLHFAASRGHLKVWIMCFLFSFNFVRFCLTRETNKK